MITTQYLTIEQFESKYGHLVDSVKFKTKQQKVNDLIQLFDGKVTEKDFDYLLNTPEPLDNNFKYRVPDVSEFVNGFEYEIYSEGFNEGDLEDFCDWYPYKFGVHPNWRELEEIEQELINNNIRVKIK